KTRAAPSSSCHFLSSFSPPVSLGYYVMRKYTDSQVPPPPKKNKTSQIQKTVSPLGENPAQIMCPKCHQTVLSEVEYSSGLFTYLFCGGLFLFVFGCCLIPFCVDRLKDAKHTCPTCKTVLGVYRRL
uniref:LITAF domain-containing protein n=1 Tax=Xiphophorus maculatus TaxID=8083 RepID=A0A3B5QCS7_XIPMA